MLDILRKKIWRNVVANILSANARADYNADAEGGPYYDVKVDIEYEYAVNNVGYIGRTTIEDVDIPDVPIDDAERYRVAEEVAQKYARKLYGPGTGLLIRFNLQVPEKSKHGSTDDISDLWFVGLIFILGALHCSYRFL